MFKEPEAFVLDAASVGVLLSVIAGVLTPIAVLLTIIWTAIRIWETPTVQKWVMKEAKKQVKAEVVTEVVKAARPGIADQPAKVEAIVEKVMTNEKS